MVWARAEDVAGDRAEDGGPLQLAATLKGHYKRVKTGYLLGDP